MPKKTTSKSKKKSTFDPKHKLWLSAAFGLIVGLFVGLLIALTVADNTKNYHHASSYVGLSETKAVDKAEDNGFDSRVVKRDGEPLPVTDDLRSDRINFSVADDEVVKAKFY